MPMWPTLMALAVTPTSVLPLPVSAAPPPGPGAAAEAPLGPPAPAEPAAAGPDAWLPAAAADPVGAEEDAERAAPAAGEALPDPAGEETGADDGPPAGAPRSEPAPAPGAAAEALASAAAGAPLWSTAAAPPPPGPPGPLLSRSSASRWAAPPLQAADSRTAPVIASAPRQAFMRPPPSIRPPARHRARVAREECRSARRHRRCPDGTKRSAPLLWDEDTHPTNGGASARGCAPSGGPAAPRGAPGRTDSRSSPTAPPERPGSAPAARRGTWGCCPAPSATPGPRAPLRRPVLTGRQWGGAALGPTWVSSQALSGRAAPKKSTTRCLALAVPIQAATGHCFQAMRPLWRNSSMRGWSFG